MRERPATMNDFENLLREQAMAYAEVADDEQDLIARARELHDEQRPTQSVSIAPLTFNRDATLGRSQPLTWDPTPDEIRQGVKQSETIAFWQGTKQEAQAITVDVALVNAPPPSLVQLPFDFTPVSLAAPMTATDTVATVSADPILAGYPPNGTIKIDNELMMYGGLTTTQFTNLTRGAFNTLAVPHAVVPVAPSVFVPIIDLRPYGIVEFGSDGNHTSVRFDIGAGKRFTVVGNYCSVLVGVNQPGPGKISGNVTIGASIGAFAAPSPCPTVLTHYLDAYNYADDAPGLAAAPFIPIPLKAVQLLPIQSTLPVGTTMKIYFYPFGGGSAPSTVVTFQSSVVIPLPPVIPLIGDVSYIKIVHNAGAPFSLRLPFQLSL